MQQDYLLTYDIGNVQYYAWFPTEDELDEFVDCNKDKEGFVINDKLHILNAKELD
jgi:hypothetical protein